ncbi:MAG: LPS-assembly protein LptD [Planctomycetes bacterium]|nr:LPS-assembly protein LptD [Planctomycetota bacterium]
MRSKGLLILGFLALLGEPALPGILGREDLVSPEGRQAADVQPGGQGGLSQDLHLAGRELTIYQLRTGRAAVHVLVFRDGFSMSIGAGLFTSDTAVAWLEAIKTESGNSARLDYEGRMYLRGNVSVKKAETTETANLRQTAIEDGQATVVRFGVSGEVFVTADKKEVADPRGFELYTKALAAVTTVEPEFRLEAELPVAEAPEEKVKQEKPAEEIAPAKPAKVVAEPKEKKPRFGYPVNIAPVGEVPLQFELDRDAEIVTAIGGIYMSWQELDETTGRLLLVELQADNAVIFYSEEALKAYQESRQAASVEDILTSGAIRAIYMSGEVVMTQGQRTTRVEEIYYDFQRKKALASNVVMRNFDVSRGIPIYVRAPKLRQLAANQFAFDNITLTTSEFYVPQISLNASNVIITDTTPIDEQGDRISDSSYDVQMRDVRFKMYDRTIFYWPSVRSNLQRPDIPLKGVHAGHDGTWGTSLETRWHLARLLGLREPEGTESTVSLDYYSKRGPGSGVEINYERENYFGRMIGYIIDDHGEDRLGRDDSRRGLEPPRELRGRVRWQHRQFLPYNWQFTTEASYASDPNFIEQYYRSEFNTDKEQETIVHVKRLEDNWALALLGKWRLNDFVDKVEELPSAEFHWTGQSFLDDNFTFYSDSQLSRFRQRLAEDDTMSEDFFTFASTRNEVDMPVRLGKSKVVPFVAGTLGYEDGVGFETDIDGSTVDDKDGVWLGEAGVRASAQPYWKVFPDAKSRFWDLNQLRHVIKPHVTAVGYAQSDSVVEQRDTLNVGISQRLQTRRGPAGKQRTVDWMRLDMDVTWVNDSGDTAGGPDRFIWNKPYIPLVNRYSMMAPPKDRRSSDVFGPRRNYFSTDYIWRMSDTTAVLSDMNFDMQSGVVQQFNIGFSHLRWPNLGYYIGSRYLRRVDSGFGEKGSNAFTFAATYVLDPRYTLVFSQQFDFDYGANIRSDVTLIRRYHRICLGLTYSADESLDQHSVVFSLWPAGVPELVIGPRRYMELGGGYN